MLSLSLKDHRGPGWSLLWASVGCNWAHEQSGHSCQVPVLLRQEVALPLL